MSTTSLQEKHNVNYETFVPFLLYVFLTEIQILCCFLNNIHTVSGNAPPIN
jgi:hypothetical protein